MMSKKKRKRKRKKKRKKKKNEVMKSKGMKFLLPKLDWKLKRMVAKEKKLWN